MTRQEQRQDTYENLWNEHSKAFQQAQWFWASGYYQRRMLSAQNKLAAYNTKYGPFTVTLTSGVVLTTH